MSGVSAILNWLRGVLRPGPGCYELLLVEETRHHGQVLLPILRDLHDAGVSWRLLIHPQHHDLETIRSQYGDHHRVRLLEESPWFRCAQLLAEVAASRPRSAWFLSPTHEGLWSLLTARVALAAGHVAITLHSARYYPSPRSFQPTIKGRFGLSVFWRILCPEPVVTLSESWTESLPQLFVSLSRVKCRVYSPLLAAATEPTSEKVKFFLPGPLVSECRDFDVLLDALERLPEDIPIEIVVAGSQSKLGPNDQVLLKLMEADTRFRLEMRDWFELEELTELAASCHFLLQMPDLDSTRVYTSSVQFFRNGLPRPLLAAWSESDFRYLDGRKLAEQMELAVDEVQSGAWEERVSEMRARSARIKTDNQNFLRELAN